MISGEYPEPPKSYIGMPDSQLGPNTDSVVPFEQNPRIGAQEEIKMPVGLDLIAALDRGDYDVSKKLEAKSAAGAHERAMNLAGKDAAKLGFTALGSIKM